MNPVLGGSHAQALQAVGHITRPQAPPPPIPRLGWCTRWCVFIGCALFLRRPLAMLFYWGRFIGPCGTNNLIEGALTGAAREKVISRLRFN